MECRRLFPLNRGRPFFPKLYCSTARKRAQAGGLGIVTAQMFANPATVAAALGVFLYGGSGETMPSDSLLEQLGPGSALLHGAGPLPVSRLTDQFQAPQALSQTGIVDMACCLQPDREGTFLLRAGY